MFQAFLHISASILSQEETKSLYIDKCKEIISALATHSAGSNIVTEFPN